MYIKFNNEQVAKAGTVTVIKTGVVAVKMEIMEKNTSGFKVYLDGACTKLLGNYSEYTTVYKEPDARGMYYSTGEVEEEPAPVPEPVPYVPTLQELKDAKVQEMNEAQQTVIANGVDVTLSDGTVEHFTLTDHDQTSLMGLQSQVAAGVEKIPWHTSDHAEHCKYYNTADMAKIIEAAMNHVTFHVTYFRDLRIYINSLTKKEKVEAVTYGMTIPAKYQSEPLADMYASISNE